MSRVPLATILAGNLRAGSWLRVEGRGDHRLAPTLKLWAKQELAAGNHQLILDLENCTGLDSTFLGTMAALMIEAEQVQGFLRVVRAQEAVLRAIQLMGLDQLTQVHADLGEYAQQEAEIKIALEEFERQSLSLEESTRFSLEAHKQLQATSEENRLRFADVVKLMEASLRGEG